MLALNTTVQLEAPIPVSGEEAFAEASVASFVSGTRALWQAYGRLATKDGAVVMVAPSDTVNRANTWQHYLLDPAAPATVAAISETIAAAYKTLSIYGPTGLSLLKLRADSVQGEHLAAVLRASFRLRNQIPGWKPALEVARTALLRQGIDPADALVGLNK